MGIVSCKEIAEQRRGPTFAGDGSFQRTYSRVWRVITDGYKIGGLEALVNGTGIPGLYVKYDTRPQGGVEWDNGAIVVGYDTYQPDASTPNLWYARVDYSSKSIDPAVLNSIAATGGTPAGSPSGGGDMNENPLLRPLQVSFRTQKEHKTLYRSFGYTEAIVGSGEPEEEVFDETRIPFINSANQAYSPGPQVPQSIKILTIVRNELSYDPTFDGLGQYEDTVNSTSFLGHNAGTVRCDFIDGQNDYANGIGYVIVTYVFSIKVRNDGPGEAWDWKPIDEGTYALLSTQKDVPTDRAGRDLGGRVFLDGQGGKLADNATPFFNSFRIYQRMNLNDLGLP